MKSSDHKKEKGDSGLTGNEISSILKMIAIGILLFILLFKKYKTDHQITEEINSPNLEKKVPNSIIKTVEPIQKVEFFQNNANSVYTTEDINYFEIAKSDFLNSRIELYEISCKINWLINTLNDFSNYLIDFCDENEISSGEKIKSKNLTEFVISADNFITNFNTDAFCLSKDALSDKYSGKIKDMITKIVKICISIVSLDQDFLSRKKALIFKWKKFLKIYEISKK